MTFLRKLIVILLGIFLVLVILFGGYVIVGSVQNAPMPITAEALVSDDVVTVTNNPWLTFSPTGQTPTTGFILYPGGLVPAQAYAPTARAIAAEGYLVVLPSMPMNLAVFAPNLADQIVPAFPMIDTWAIGGHSLGGAMASTYVDGHPDQMAGLALWASYPAESNSLAADDLTVVSLFGTRDGVAPPETVLASEPLLPPSAEFIPIDGGNHSQFGFYGDGLQSGDNPATISLADQQQITVMDTAEMLRALP